MGTRPARCAGPLAQPLPAPVRYQHLLEGVEVLNAFARAEHDRLQRIAGQLDRHPCLFAQPLIKAAQVSLEVIGRAVRGARERRLCVQGFLSRR